jgi:hypothetical protein
MPRGYNLSFKMLMEGVLTPFKSANIICTPNGVEMTINIFANKLVYDLKPKTAVQIFYKDWIDLPVKGWRLLGDGFFSAIVKEDSSTEGRMVAITCRDFRMDIRKAPAYLSYTGDEPLGVLNMYAMQGLYDHSIVKGSKLGAVRNVGDREYDNQLCSLSELMRYIAGTAYNSGTTSKKAVAKNTTPVDKNIPDAFAYHPPAQAVQVPSVGYIAKTTLLVVAQGAANVINKSKTTLLVVAQGAANVINKSNAVIQNAVGNILIPATTDLSGTSITKPDDSTKTVYQTMADSFQNNEEGKAKCGLFLDAFIRGLWSEAVGGTSIGVFTNKRIRMDKRFLVPSNRAGYNFWNRMNSSIEVGGYMMGDSRFTSIEAAIMRCAGLFSVRVYSCNTPTLIPISEEKSASNPYSSDPYAADVYNHEPTIGKVVDFIIDKSVRQNLVDNLNNNFGAKYILNQSMLLPPMEFTAPPNCNVFLPPFCNRIAWQFDMDSDITRGYYSVVDSMSGYNSTQGLNRLGIQVPNTLFDRSETQSSLYKGTSKIDQYGRYKPPITLEERYKGVSVAYGQVNQDIAMDETVAELRANPGLVNKAKADQIKAKHDALESGTTDNYNKTVVLSQINVVGSTSAVGQALDYVNKLADQKNAAAAAQEAKKESSTTNALRRHAIIKYLNEKYAGRVVTIDMMFNPFPTCGFPGMYIDDEEANGDQSGKTVIGMVQQVKHIIVINPNSAEASTTVLMNNVRFIDEPTDMDADGNALYLGATNHYKARININTLLYGDKNYHVADPVIQTGRVLNSQAYDIAMLSLPNPVYAKDFLSITAKSALGGRSNIYYLDKEYDPQHVCLFYKKVFQHTENSFMIGSETGTPDAGNGTLYFVYDTMHEAVEKLRENRKELLYDYNAAMLYVSRNVCSADAFYHGILGLSVLNTDNKGNQTFINKKGINGQEFDDSDIRDEYYGVTTEKFNNDSSKYLRQNTDVINFDRKTGRVIPPGLMSKAGEFSSILETTPVTAFISERKDAVKKYIALANQTAQGMRFSAPPSEA